MVAAVGLVGAVQPLRAWVGRWLLGVWAQLAGFAKAPEGPAVPLRDTPHATAPVLWFAPSGPRLRVTLTGRQRTGSLLIQRAPGSGGSLQLDPSDPAAMPLLSERGIEIRNAPSTRSDYLLRVPTSIRQVIVQIGAETSRIIDQAELGRGSGFQLDLSSGGRMRNGAQD